VAEVASAYVSLLPSLRGGAGAISREINGPLNTASSTAGTNAGRTYGRKFGGAASGLMKAALGGVLVAGAAGFLKDAFSEAREAQKVGAQTEQVIKSTGSAAKVTAGQIGDLSSAISAKTGIDDEAIQSGANLLLTFTNVKNEVGKGNDVFNQATQAITDMGAAMGSEPKAAAVQLGKALNDPVKGVTALTKVGVAFTNQQKAQIKAMVEGGDANAAVSLGLLGSTKEYGALLKANKGNAQKVADILTKDLSPAEKKHFDTLSAGNDTLGAQKIILKELKTEFGGQAEAQATAGDKAKVAFGNLKEAVGTALLPALDKGMVAVTGLFTELSGKLGPVLSEVGTFITGTLVPALVSFGTWISQNKDTLITAGIALGTFLAIMKTAAVIRNFTLAIQAMRAAGVAATLTQWGLNAALLANPITWIVVGIAALVAALVVFFTRTELGRKLIKAAWAGIKAAIKSVSDWFTQTALPALKKAFNVLWDFLKFMWKWSPIGLVVANWGKVKGAFSTVLTSIKGFFSTAWETMKKVFRWTPIGLITTNWNKIVGFFEGLPGKVSSAVSGIWDGLTTGFKSALNSIIGMWNNLSLKIPAVKVLGKTVFGGATIDTPNINFLAAGGIVTGPTLAMVGEGPEPEAVIPLSKLNAMLNPARGGNAPTFQFDVHGDVVDWRAQLHQMQQDAADAMTIAGLRGTLS
jgi:hypothetical protein